MFSRTLLLALLAPLTAAWPTAPGSCLTPNPQGATHLLNPVGATELSDFQLSVMIGDVVLDPATPFDVTMGMDHEISLSASAGSFRGFLMRLGKDAVDTTGFLSSEDANVQVFGLCNPAAGLAHNNNTEKMTVKGMLNADMVMEGLTLDVSSVISNGVAVPGSGSEYYLSQYTINVVEAAAVVPTDAPVPAPTDAPVADPVDPIDPTEAPVPAPTDAPVPAPTDAPVEDAPTDAPVDSSASNTVPMLLLAVIGTGVSMMM